MRLGPDKKIKIRSDTDACMFVLKSKVSQISISNQQIECQATERKANTGKAESERF